MEQLHLLTLFADLMTDFINADSSVQKKWLEEGENFFQSYIKPIVKGSDLDATSAKSYRPISVSHVVCVLFERVIAMNHFSYVKPKNFFGYIPGRSCDFAVKTLKNLVAQGQKGSAILVMLDASGAFESVIWDKIFPRLRRRNSPRIIRAIWQMYRFNRYIVRWKNSQSQKSYYCTQGTKQGGLLSGPIFVEYMNLLGIQLARKGGITFNGSLWNSLFYADDVMLVCWNLFQAQMLLDICQEFETKGYVKWNASKTVVIKIMEEAGGTLFTADKKVPSGLFLNGEPLELKENGKYLGYIINCKLDDRDMIARQARRLYAITNNLDKSLPLELLGPSRLNSLCRAYGGIYMMSIIETVPKTQFAKLRKAHRYMVETLTQTRQRCPEWYDKDQVVWQNTNTNIYNRAQIPKFDIQVGCIKEAFFERYEQFLSSIRYREF